MADFTTPFGNSATRRFPNNNEKTNGFPCGPADQTLFNGLFHRLEAEVGEVISHAGLTGSNSDLTQLRQAIIAIIASQTGGGNTEDYLLISQASTRLPIFPTIENTANAVNCVSPGVGICRVPAGVNVTYRGVKVVTTVETDLSLSASKIYHIRMGIDGTISAKDLADSAYNPDTDAETDSRFDSTYDDLLIARAVTNSSNVVTITNLVNKHELKDVKVLQGDDPQDVSGLYPNFRFQTSYNWGRTPQPLLFTILAARDSGLADDTDFAMYEPGGNMHTDAPNANVDRYGFHKRMQRDHTSDLWVSFRLEA